MEKCRQIHAWSVISIEIVAMVTMDGWKGGWIDGWSEEGPLFASFRCGVSDRREWYILATIKQQNENTYCVVFVFCFTEDDKGMLNSSSSSSSEIISWKQKRNIDWTKNW